MIKNRNSNPQPQPPSGISRLLMESFKAIKSNWKLLLPVLVSVHLIEPVVQHLIYELMKRSQLFQDLENNMHQTGYISHIEPISEVLLVNIFIIKLCYITPLLFWDATTSSSSKANSTSKLIDLKEMILKLNKSRNKPTLMIFHTYLVAMGPIFEKFCAIGITYVLAKDSWTCVIYGVLLLLCIVYEFYVSALGVMSLVVSALEDVGGLNAIVRAREVMKGENIQACVIMVLSTLLYILVYSTTNGISCDIEKWSRLAVLTRLCNGLIPVLKLFVFMVFTVLYLERKEGCGEKELKEVKSL